MTLWMTGEILIIELPIASTMVDVKPVSYCKILLIAKSQNSAKHVGYSVFNVAIDQRNDDSVSCMWYNDIDDICD